MSGKLHSNWLLLLVSLLGYLSVLNPQLAYASSSKALVTDYLIVDQPPTDSLTQAFDGNSATRGQLYIAGKVDILVYLADIVRLDKVIIRSVTYSEHIESMSLRVGIRLGINKQDGSPSDGNEMALVYPCKPLNPTTGGDQASFDDYVCKPACDDQVKGVLAKEILWTIKQSKDNWFTAYEFEVIGVDQETSTNLLEGRVFEPTDCRQQVWALIAGDNKIRPPPFSGNQLSFHLGTTYLIKQFIFQLPNRAMDNIDVVLESRPMTAFGQSNSETVNKSPQAIKREWSFKNSKCKEEDSKVNTWRCDLPEELQQFPTNRLQISGRGLRGLLYISAEGQQLVYPQVKLRKEIKPDMVTLTCELTSGGILLDAMRRTVNCNNIRLVRGRQLLVNPDGKLLTELAQHPGNTMRVLTHSPQFLQVQMSRTFHYGGNYTCLCTATDILTSVVASNLVDLQGTDVGVAIVNVTSTNVVIRSNHSYIVDVEAESIDSGWQNIQHDFAEVFISQEPQQGDYMRLRLIYFTSVPKLQFRVQYEMEPDRNEESLSREYADELEAFAGMRGTWNVSVFRHECLIYPGITRGQNITVRWHSVANSEEPPLASNMLYTEVIAPNSLLTTKAWKWSQSEKRLEFRVYSRSKSNSTLFLRRQLCPMGNQDNWVELHISDTSCSFVPPADCKDSTKCPALRTTCWPLKYGQLASIDSLQSRMSGVYTLVAKNVSEDGSVSETVLSRVLPSNNPETGSNMAVMLKSMQWNVDITEILVSSNDKTLRVHSLKVDFSVNHELIEELIPCGNVLVKAKILAKNLDQQLYQSVLTQNKFQLTVPFLSNEISQDVLLTLIVDQGEYIKVNRQKTITIPNPQMAIARDVTANVGTPKEDQSSETLLTVNWLAVEKSLRPLLASYQLQATSLAVVCDKIYRQNSVNKTFSNFDDKISAQLGVSVPQGLYLQHDVTIRPLFTAKDNRNGQIVILPGQKSTQSLKTGSKGPTRIQLLDEPQFTSVKLQILPSQSVFSSETSNIACPARDIQVKIKPTLSLPSNFKIEQIKNDSAIANESSSSSSSDQFVIYSVKDLWPGREYIVVAKTSYKNGEDELSEQLTFNTLDQIIVNQTEATVRQRDPFSISCKASVGPVNFPHRKVLLWQLQSGHLLPPDTRYELSSDGSEAILSISSAASHHGTTYACLVQPMAKGSKPALFTLHVNDLTISPKTSFVVEHGGEVEATCASMGAVRLEWDDSSEGVLKGSMEVTEKRSPQETQLILKLKSVSEVNAGQYYCIKKDENGNVVGKNQLSVNLKQDVQITEMEGSSSLLGEWRRLKCVGRLGISNQRLIWLTVNNGAADTNGSAAAADVEFPQCNNDDKDSQSDCVQKQEKDGGVVSVVLRIKNTIGKFGANGTGVSCVLRPSTEYGVANNSYQGRLLQVLRIEQNQSTVKLNSRFQIDCQAYVTRVGQVLTWIKMISSSTGDKSIGNQIEFTVQQLNGQEGSQIDKTKPEISRLIIEKVGVEHVGEYLCVLYDKDKDSSWMQKLVGAQNDDIKTNEPAELLSRRQLRFEKFQLNVENDKEKLSQTGSDSFASSLVFSVFPVLLLNILTVFVITLH